MGRVKKAGEAAAEASKAGYIRRLERRVEAAEERDYVEARRRRAFEVFKRITDFLLALVRR